MVYNWNRLKMKRKSYKYNEPPQEKNKDCGDFLLCHSHIPHTFILQVYKLNSVSFLAQWSHLPCWIYCNATLAWQEKGYRVPWSKNVYIKRKFRPGFPIEEPLTLPVNSVIIRPTDDAGRIAPPTSQANIRKPGSASMKNNMCSSQVSDPSVPTTWS